MIDLDGNLIRAPLPGESLYGYLAEIVAAQGLDRIALLSGESDREHGHRPHLATGAQDEIPDLADALGIDVAELELRSHPTLPEDPGRRAFFGTSIARIDLRSRTRFFSPAALEKAPVHQAIWTLRIPFDVETGEILIADCVLCSRIQRWRHTAGVAFCDDCGESLIRPVERIDPDLLFDLVPAVGLTHPDPAERASSLAALPDEVASLGPADAFELLLRLVPVIEPECGWTSCGRIWRNDPHAIARGMAGAWRILAGWPVAMTDLISSNIATSDRRHSDGNRGATSRFLRLRDLSYLSEALRDVIRRLHESIDTTGPDGERLRSLTLTSVEVSRLINYGTAQVVALRRQGVFRTIGLARGPVMVPVFDRDEVMEVAGELRTRRDLDRANGLFGLPYYAVEQLCALGHLPLLTHPFFAARYTEPQTTKAKLDDLVDRLTANRKPRTDDSRPILEEMRSVGGRLKPWDAVIEAMLSGALRYSLDDGADPVFDRVRVRRADLTPHIATPITRPPEVTPLTARIDTAYPVLTHMTKCDAAEVLNLAVNQATKLLSAFPTTPKPIVPISEVQRLARTYVTNTEIGARLEIPTQTVRKAARDLSIAQASDAGYERIHEPALIDACRELIAERHHRSG